MHQQIRFVTASDGVRLAVATMGAGPPLLIVPGWISHLELDWTWPAAHDLYDRLAQSHQLIRYDKRGTGLSDRNVADYSLEAQVRDLRAVIEGCDLQGTALLGYSQGGPIAVAYAVQHPESVSHLVLYGTYPNGDNVLMRDLIEAIIAMIRADWGGYGATTMLEMFIPGASPNIRQAFTEYQRQSANADDAIALMKAIGSYNVTSLLPKVAAPTLVLHRREDKACPFQGGRELAAGIPGARFVPLEGDIHVISLGDTDTLVNAVEEFLSDSDAGAGRKVGGGLQTILFTDMEGSTGLTQRLGDEGSQELLRVHNEIIREALNVNGGTEIKHTGDGIMAAFSSASRAIACAISIERRFDSHNESDPQTPIHVRIGLNAGEPVAEEDPDGRADLFGTAVQLASRVCAHSTPGQILASNVVRELSAGKRFLWSDVGNVALRGFDDPVRLFEVKWRS